MPVDGAGQDLGLFEEFLNIILAKMLVPGMQSGDIVGRLELGHGYEAHLVIGE